jgi:hypothetical protein
MTRAVAEKGAELVKGIHKSQGGLAITVKQANGLVREIPWDEEAQATPVLVDAMILDLEIENPELREATREYCLNRVNEWSKLFQDPEEACGMPMNSLYTQAEAFMAGYGVALGKMQPYWKNPLPTA